jgi:hypothetical protein
VIPLPSLSSVPSATGGATWVDIATLITAIAAAATAVVTGIAVVADGRRTRLSIGISNLWRLIEVWDGVEMRSRRALLARAVRERPRERNSVTNNAIDVLNNFELLGYLVRAKVLRLEDAWVNFSGWALSWWIIYEPEIRRLQREEDPTLFEDYAALVAQFVEFEAGRRNIVPEDVLPGPDAVTDFLKAEEALIRRLRPQAQIRSKRSSGSLTRWWSWLTGASATSQTPSGEEDVGSEGWGDQH